MFLHENPMGAYRGISVILLGCKIKIKKLIKSRKLDIHSYYISKYVFT